MSLMTKIKHEKDFVLEHEGKRWTIDCAVWLDHKTGKGEFRVYRIDGDITNEAVLCEAIELEAQSRALTVQPYKLVGR